MRFSVFYIFLIFPVYGNIKSGPYELLLLYNVYSEALSTGYLQYTGIFSPDVLESLKGLQSLALLQQIFISTQSVDAIKDLAPKLTGTDISSVETFFENYGTGDSTPENPKIKAGFLAANVFPNIKNTPPYEFNWGNANSNFASKMTMLFVNAEVLNVYSINSAFLPTIVNYLEEIVSIRSEDFIDSLNESQISKLSELGLDVSSESKEIVLNPEIDIESFLSEVKVTDFGSVKLSMKTHLENILYFQKGIQQLNLQISC